MKKITNIKFALLAIFAGLFLTASAQAATFTVNSILDPGVLPGCDAVECTLREAITAANATASAGDRNPVIEFDPVVFGTPQTITLSGTELAFSFNSNISSLTINGPGANMLTVSGNNQSRVIYISSTTVIINDLTISDGNGVGNGVAGRGGGVYASASSLSINNCVIKNNTAATQGGGVYLQSGTINNSTISDNSAPNGGGFYKIGGTVNNSIVRNNMATDSGGGVYQTSGNVVNTTIRNNSAVNDGGGLYVSFGSGQVRNSTINNNSAGRDGGGAYIFQSPSLSTLTNVTVSGNQAVGNGGGIYNRLRLFLESVTVTGNSAASGGGIFSPFFLSLNNTIIANNTTGGDCVRTGGTINATYSLIEDGLTCVNGTNTNNLTGEPNLGPLQNNGGPTQTHALLTGSIAIDKGNTNLTTDQRGVMRPQGAADDIGSFELETSKDGDGDGILDDMDNCPNTANADQADFDQDGIGDACDDDDDNDGVADVNDAFPFDPTESVDTDGDGIGNNADLDDDNDGQLDADEISCGSDPLDAMSKSPDADSDNIPDCVDPDDDNDGIPDTCDIDSNPGAEDFDRDGIVDNSDCDTQIGPPVDKDQCKNDGFMGFNNPTFRNQGQCVSYVNGRRP